MKSQLVVLVLVPCVLAMFGCSPAEEGSAPAPLNVLFITTDDLGLQLGSYGETVIETPNLDKLAASGVQFNVAYVAQASCSPSRSAMFTGMFGIVASWRCGCRLNSEALVRPYWPLAWLYMPERITDRLALQLAVVQKALVKRTPSAASASRLGVLMTGLP